MSAPGLSVVIPARDPGALLLEQLRALETSARTVGARVEILVSDNGTTDGSLRLLDELAHEVRIVDSSSRSSVSHARNIGISAATFDWIAICDADDVVSSTWLSSMLEALAEGARYVTGPLDLDRLNPPEWAGMRGRSHYEHLARYGDLIPFAHGCNIGLHREVLDLVGGFDEEIASGDDIEFAVRAWRQGIALEWHEQALVHYRFRPTLTATYRQGRSYGAVRRELRRRVPEARPARRAIARSMARRSAWLLRHGPHVITDRGIRARWIWVASQLHGEIFSYLGKRPRSGPHSHSTRLEGRDA